MLADTPLNAPLSKPDPSRQRHADDHVTRQAKKKKKTHHTDTETETVRLRQTERLQIILHTNRQNNRKTDGNTNKHRSL